MTNSPPSPRGDRPRYGSRSAAVWVRYLVRPSYQPRGAALWGLSRRGVRLLAEQALEPGTPVLLELPGPEPASSCGRLARVTSAECAGEGYLLQCCFAKPLEAQGLAVILRGLAPQEQTAAAPAFYPVG